MSNSQRVRVCVAGCGHWGKNLARNFHQMGELAAICEADTERLAAFAAQYPEAAPYSDLREMLRDHSISRKSLYGAASGYCAANAASRSVSASQIAASSPI